MDAPTFTLEREAHATGVGLTLRCTVCGYELDADLDFALDRAGYHMACHGCSVVHRVPTVQALTGGQDPAGATRRRVTCGR